MTLLYTKGIDLLVVVTTNSLFYEIHLLTHTHDNLNLKKIFLFSTENKLSKRHLTVTTEREGVATLPGSTTARTLGVVETVTLTMTTRLLTDSSKTARFTVLVDRVGDPVDTGIATDSLVRRIDKDDFKVLVSSVLVDPVRVQHTEVSTLTANTFFSSGTERTLVLQLRNTLIDRLTESSTLRNRSLTATTTHTDTVDDKTLLGLVTQTTSLVRTRRARSTVNDIQLSEFPTSNTEQETGNIRLLLSGKFFEILVGYNKTISIYTHID
jgi:hypothetical protein